jgi:hypothetical protein
VTFLGGTSVLCMSMFQMARCASGDAGVNTSSVTRLV